jgi:hypothetical protein
VCACGAVESGKRCQLRFRRTRDSAPSRHGLPPPPSPACLPASLTLAHVESLARDPVPPPPLHPALGAAGGPDADEGSHLYALGDASVSARDAVARAHVNLFSLR